MEEMLSIFGDLWALVASDGDDGMGISEFPAAVPFDTMIGHPKIAHLFEQSRTLKWGRGEVFPVFISTWEHLWYNQPLFDNILSSRRSRSITEKLHRDCMRMKHQVTKNWRQRANYDASQRRVYMGIQKLAVRKRIERGFLAFLVCKQRHSVALDLQRVLRGHFGRQDARIKRNVYRSATRIQTRWRMFLARQEMRQRSLRYTTAT